MGAADVPAEKLTKGVQERLRMKVEDRLCGMLDELDLDRGCLSESVSVRLRRAPRFLEQSRTSGKGMNIAQF